MTSLPLKKYVDALGEVCLAWDGYADMPVTGACADSRQVQPGYLFCAIPGAREDGAQYVPDALRRGAAGIVSMTEVEAPDGIARLRVSDAYRAAGLLAECGAERPADALKLLGITGTNGKTTCAFLLRDMLRCRGDRVGMVGTVAYDVGNRTLSAERTTPTPFVLQDLLREMRDSQCTWAVLEMSSHALAQYRTGSADFAGALFTNMTGDHLDYHKTMERYFDAKAILFRELLAPSAPAVLNLDDPYGQRLLADMSRCCHTGACMTYGQHPDADVTWRHVEVRLDGMSFEWVTPHGSIHLTSPLIGHHNVANIAGSGALALACGVGLDAIRQAVERCGGAPGRLEPVASRLGFTAYVDYAHTDDALENVLVALRRLEPNRLFLVFGCGGDRDRGKRPRMGAVAAQLADVAIVTSDNPRREKPGDIITEILKGMAQPDAVHVVPDRREAIRMAVEKAGTGDVILVAGKGHETYQEIGEQRIAFDDMQVLREAIGKREGTEENI